MAKPILLANRFDRMVRDEPRNNMPPGACWNLVDWIPGELDAPLVKRGGFTYESEALTSVLAGADYVDSVIYAPFAAGGQLLAVPVNSGVAAELSQIVSTSSTTDRSTLDAPLGPMTFYRNKVYITSAIAGLPYSYDGSSNATIMAGTTPAGTLSIVYKDRLIIANSAVYPQRVWFSGAGDPTSWDLTNRWIDTSGVIRGIYSLRNAILIWHPGTMERIIGAIPPPGTDMSLQPLSDVGLGPSGMRSLAGTDEFVCFANSEGVHMTDGASVTDLTEQGGIKSWWLNDVAPTATDGIFAGGWFRGYYFIAPQGADEVYVCNVASRRWFTFSGINARCFARRTDGKEELYFGMETAARVCSMSSTFIPAAGVKNDATGTAVTPILETPYYDLAQSKSTIRKVYFNYDLRDAASDQPVLTASYTLQPEEGAAYTTVVGQTDAAYTLAETTERTRVRRLIRKPTFGIALKLAQTNASSHTRLYSIESEAHGREDSRV